MNKRQGVGLLCALGIVAGCKAKEEKAAPAASASAASVATTPTAAPPPSPAAAETPPTPNWMKDVPSKPVRAKVGDTVWAVVPSSSQSDTDIGRLGAFKVDAIKGNIASVSGKRGKFDVPGLFVWPIGDMTKLKAGDAVVAPYDQGWGPGRVVKNDSGKVTVHFLLSNNTAVDKPVDVATAIPPGSTAAPFSDVYFEKFPGKNYNGFVLAQEGGTSWVLNHDDSFLTETKAKLVPLKWAFKDRKVGDKVKVFAGMGATDATIKKVLDPKDYFEVDLTGTPMSATFDQIVDKL